MTSGSPKAPSPDGPTPPPNPPAYAPPLLTVRSLRSDPALGIELVLLAGEAGLDRQIKHARIQKSGLALVGHFHGIVPSRIQILGQTELSFLHRLAGEDRKNYLRGFFKLSLSCVILTTALTQHDEGSGVGVMPVPELTACAEEAETPLLLSSERSSVTINALHTLLDDRLAPRVRMHGVLVDVFGVGLLLVGPSAIGKSETALDLVMRGHRLVADDAVECDYRPPGMVFGAAAELLRHHLEVRGLGILNIKDLYGVTAIRERKRIDVVVRLVEWSKDTEYDRLGLDDRRYEVLGVPIRELMIPVRPGRDMASILEVAARNELLKNAGHHAAREFFGNLEGALLGSERPTNESAVLPPVYEGITRPSARHVPPPPSSGAAAPRIREPESIAPRPRPPAESLPDGYDPRATSRAARPMPRATESQSTAPSSKPRSQG
jgi:HPr kinase/phosphorylase